MLTIDPLFADIQPQNSSFKIVSTKIDVALRKSRPGLRWPTLEGASESVVDVASESFAEKSAWARECDAESPVAGTSHQMCFEE